MNQPPHWQQPYPPAPQQPPKRREWPLWVGLGCGVPVAVLAAAALFCGIMWGSADTPTAKPSAKTTTSSTLDDAGRWACTDFAEDYPSAQTQQARLNLADKVNEWAPHSDTPGIADNAVLLARTADKSDGAWQIAADAFAQSCLDAGWGD